MGVSLEVLRESFPDGAKSLLFERPLPDSFCGGAAEGVSDPPPPPPPPPPAWGAAGGWKFCVAVGAGERGLVGGWDGDWAPLIGRYSFPCTASLGVLGGFFPLFRRRLRIDAILKWLSRGGRLQLRLHEPPESRLRTPGGEAFTYTTTTTTTTCSRPSRPGGCSTRSSTQTETHTA